MVKKPYLKSTALLLSLLMAMSPVTVLAGNISDDEAGVSEAALDEAMEKVDEDEKEELGDGRKGALYLAYHRQEDVIEPKITSESTKDYPETYDLRDKGVVTPVKLQNPFGTCWGFSAIAAAETSILSEMGATYDELPLDLSEHHLTYFARTHIDDPDDPQNGEGIYVEDGVNQFNTGGLFITAADLFSSGVGPVYESDVPYRGKDSDTESYLLGLYNMNYSENDDWTLPEDYKYVQKFQLTESNVLTSPATYPDDIGSKIIVKPYEGEQYYGGFNQAGVDAIKDELMNGRAVSIAFCADQSMPGESNEKGRYLTETSDGKWLHYTFDYAQANHAVTIVGWDDTIKKESFLDHTNDEDGDGQAHIPEGDGAFIVKNSWGSQNGEFPNFSTWGSLDENGNHTGYFYLSYYDTSIQSPESFEFSSKPNNGAYIIDQYDYMQSSEVSSWLADTGLQMANRFTAEHDQIITDVSCETGEADMSVVYQIYLLDNGANTPDDGKLVSAMKASYPYAGYHRIKLDEPVEVKEGQQYAVVVTQCLDYDGTLYYGLNTSKEISEEGVQKHNEDVKELYKEKYPDEDPDDNYDKVWAKGVINPKESYVYIDDIGQWFDLADMIDTIKLNAGDEYEMEYDNFPIKAYSQFVSAEEKAEYSSDTLPEDLTFSAPATEWNFKTFIRNLSIVIDIAVLVIAAIVIIIIILVKRHKKKKAAKAAEAEAASEQNYDAEAEPAAAIAENTEEEPAEDSEENPTEDGQEDESEDQSEEAEK